MGRLQLPCTLEPTFLRISRIGRQALHLRLMRSTGKTDSQHFKGHICPACLNHARPLPCGKRGVISPVCSSACHQSFCKAPGHEPKHEPLPKPNESGVLLFGSEAQHPKPPSHTQDLKTLLGPSFLVVVEPRPYTKGIRDLVWVLPDPQHPKLPKRRPSLGPSYPKP